MRPPSATVWLKAHVGEPAECAPQPRPTARPYQELKFINDRRHMVRLQRGDQKGATAESNAETPCSITVSFTGAEIPARQNTACNKCGQNNDPIEFATVESACGSGPDSARRRARRTGRSVRFKRHHPHLCWVVSWIVRRDTAKQIRGDQKRRTLTI